MHHGLSGSKIKKQLHGTDISLDWLKLTLTEGWCYMYRKKLIT